MQIKTLLEKNLNIGVIRKAVELKLGLASPVA